jgi:hypothetical protein
VSGLAGGKLKHAQGYEFNCKCLFFNMELGVLNILLLAGCHPYFNLGNTSSGIGGL